MDDNGKISLSVEDRLTVGANEFLLEKSVQGSHSLTEREAVSMSKVREYILVSKLSGKNLELRNSEGVKYYLVEDGTIFKYDDKKFSFYRLDLDNFAWISDQTLAGIYFDTFLKFQELPGFNDYFSDVEEINYGKGMNI